MRNLRQPLRRNACALAALAMVLFHDPASATAEVPVREIDLASARARTMLAGPASGEISPAMRQAAARLDQWVDGALARQIRDKTQKNYGAINPVDESDKNFSYVGISELLPPSVQVATAYSCRASKHYHSPKVKDAVELSLRYVMHWAYPGCRQIHNWWCWQMAMPEQICDLLILMANDLSPDVRRNFEGVLDQVNPPRPIGDPWGSYHSALLGYTAFRAGLVLKDQRRLRLALQGIKRATQWPWVFGMQYDFSNHDSGPNGIGGMDLAYNDDMIEAVGRYVYATRGTSLQLDARSIEGVTGFILEFQRWNIWHGWSNPYLHGRSMTQPRHANGADQSIGTSVYLAAAGVQRADELAAVMKRFVQELPPSRWQRKWWLPGSQQIPGAPLGEIALIDEIQRRPEPAETPPVGARYWPWNEEMVYRRPEYFASLLISGAAKPTITWYQINEESNRSWHERDGNLLLLHDRWDFAPDFGPAVFATLDWDRLTGITAEDGSHYQSSERSRNPFSGGVTLDARDGVAGVDLRVGTLQARKSYAFIDGAIVCQASRVRSTRRAETVVQQVPLRSLKDEIWVDGKRQTLEPGKPTVLSGVRWLHAGRDGWAFAPGTRVTLLLEERRGSLRAVNAMWGDDKEVCRPYLQIYIEHGVSAVDAQCAYVMWPAADRAAMDDLTAGFARDIRLIRTATVHGVKAPSVLALVFFEPGQAEGYGVDRPGLLLARSGSRGVRLAVTEPSLRGEEIVVTLPFAVDPARLPEGVSAAGKPNVVRVAIRKGLQREFELRGK